MSETEEFLLSGEFHYFRIPRAVWRERLEQMAQAGLTAASIYVPWNWHQPEDEPPDLTGRTAPERDLLGALDEIASVGLNCIFRPGPFITAEWRNGGIPDRLLDEHPEIVARDATGEPVRTGQAYPAISYAHPVWRDAVRRWLVEVLDACTPRLATRGGPVINVQLDDEPSYWQQLWSPLAVDYNPYLVDPAPEGSRYGRWLLGRYGSLDAVNRLHRQVWSRPEEIEPPRCPIKQRSELIRYLDWFEYKLSIINEYVEFLHEVVTHAGVDVPVSMLYPYFLPASAVRMTDLASRLSLQLTNECYPALFSAAAGTEQKVGAIVACHEAYHMWRGEHGGPAVTMELQGSNASYLSAEAMELLYALTVARGIRGVNYYMMVGGSNPSGFENGTGVEYDISAPIGLEGSLRPHYPVISKLSEMVRAWIGDYLGSAAQPRRDVWLASYVPYEAALLSGAAPVAGLDGFEETFDMGGMGLSEAPSLVALLALNSVSFGYLDLESAGPIDPARTSQLWVAGGAFLDRAAQAELKRYVRAGGHLILSPAMPAFDAELGACDTLAALALGDGWTSGNPTSPSRRAEVGVIRTDGGETLVASGPVTAFSRSGANGGRPIARRGEDGRTCGFEVSAGDGRLTMLGWHLRYAPTAGPGQHAFTVRLAESGGPRRAAWTSGPPCCAMQLAGRRAELLCVANPVDLPCTTVINYTLAERPGGPDVSARARLPLLLDGLTLGRRGARLLPLALELGGDLCLRHATWELVGLDKSASRVELAFDVPELEGNLSAPQGELAFAGPNCAVCVTGGEVIRDEYVPEGARAIVVQAHERRVKVALCPTHR